MTPADFRNFYLSLSAPQREEFAQAAGSTVGNIESHWVSARKVPRRQAIERLHEACVKFGATFSKQELVAFFYQDEAAA